MRLNPTKVIAAFAVSLLAVPVCATAQDVAVRSVDAVETKEFTPHWFMQIQAGGAYTIGETNTFKDLVSPAAAVSVGYKFNPLLGLRVGASGWQARGIWVAPREDYKFNYMQGNVDLMLSLTNAFCGNNPSRVLDVYMFAGAGGALGFRNNEAVDLASRGYDLEKLWTGKKFFPAGRAGIGMDMNVSRRVAVNLELNANMLPDKFNSKKGSVFDWQFNALVGVTFKFGPSSKKKEVVVVEEVVEAQPEPAPAPVVVPEPVAPAPQQPVAETKPAEMRQDVFFRINSSSVRPAEQAKIEALAGYMKKYPEAKVTVTGYADKATGSARYNMSISLKRAQAVADALVEAGVASERITVDAKGDTEQPFDGIEKNRVAIAVAN